MAKTGLIRLLLVGLTAGRKAVRPADKFLLYMFFFKFDSITFIESILVLNGLLAVITYCTNLGLP